MEGPPAPTSGAGQKPRLCVTGRLVAGTPHRPPKAASSSVNSVVNQKQNAAVHGPQAAARGAWGLGHVGSSVRCGAFWGLICTMSAGAGPPGVPAVRGWPAPART